MKVFILACILTTAGVLRAAEWDFSDAMPDGCAPRPFACLVTGKGLVPAQYAERNGSPAGVEVDFCAPPPSFEFETEFIPRLEWTNAADKAAAKVSPRHNVLWDSMGVNYGKKAKHKGLQILFVDADGRWTPRLYAGFGDQTTWIAGPSFEPKANEAVRLSIRYRLFGRIEWSVNGVIATNQMKRYEPILYDPETRPVIGDRLLASYLPFNGTIRRVSIKPLPMEPIIVRPAGRQAFARGEDNAAFRLNVVCDANADIAEVEISAEQRDPETGRVYASFTDTAVGTGEMPLPTASPVKMFEFAVPVETRLRPGCYALVVSATGRRADGGQLSVEESLDLIVCPTFAKRMPAVIWGRGAGTLKDVRDFGFTHVLEDERHYSFATTNIGPLRAQGLIATYDNALANGLGMLHSVKMQYPAEGDARKNFYRQLRGGKEPTNPREVGRPEVSNPELLEYARAIAAAENEAVGYHPAFTGVDICSELRDLSFPSFNTEHLRFKAETGLDVPPEVRGRTADLKTAKARFPDGVVPVDDPLLAYYSWFWGGGDGWTDYIGGIAAEYRKLAGRYGDGSAMQRKRPFFSFWDPAVRCPPKWGSGGDVDAINQWVYANPDPMNVAGPAEEILAMAAGRHGQAPMIMTQLICYRSRIAPTNVTVAPPPEWLKRRPLAEFPTIPADSLQEAIWSMLAKPVKGVMFHGWKTIFESGQEKGYTYTSPETAARMKSLLQDTVAPLGPTLLDLGRDEPEVAVLESFETAAFGGPASWGWLSPAITFLQRARLDPRVLYEETVMRDGFGKTRILYAPQCIFLSAPVVERVKAFQEAGGILVADSELLSALKADVVVPVMAYKAPPKSDHTEDVDADTKTQVDTVARKFTEETKANMQAEAETLRKTLAERYSYAPKADSSSPEIVVYSRAWHGTPYVCAINDKRTFGDYVGQWGLTMEKGLPFSGSVTLADPDAKIGAVYELSRGGQVPFTRTADGRVKVPLSYETNDGRLLLFLEHPIAEVEVECSKGMGNGERGTENNGQTVQPYNGSTVQRFNGSTIRRGDFFAATMTVRDDTGKPVPARLPVEIRVYDAAGRELDGAGYACAEGGVYTLTIPTNLNDAPGGYRVVCRDRASGIVREARIECDDD